MLPNLWVPKKEQLFSPPPPNVPPPLPPTMTSPCPSRRRSRCRAQRIQGPKRPASSALRSDPNPFPFDTPLAASLRTPRFFRWTFRYSRGYIRGGAPSFVMTPPSENFTSKSTLSSHGSEVDPLSTQPPLSIASLFRSILVNKSQLQCRFPKPPSITLP